jgi:hydroxymethylpyrimidine/phosphomethylpyrimidine kinase
MTVIALTIAGSDSGGGAGIQADLKTFAALGVYGVSVITAVTAQNTKGVSAVHDVPTDMIAAQTDAIFSDFAVGAVKIGMLSRAATIETVAAALQRWQERQVVLDPVLIASSGVHLLAADAIDVLKRVLIPRARVLTPNLPEAAALLGLPVASTENEMHTQARRLLELGAETVVIKGGHGGGTTSVDLIVTRDDVVRLSLPRIAARNSHGTGCTFSAAIAAGLAKGLSVEAAVVAAKDYVHAALAAADALGVGSGRGPLHHFHAWW